MSWQLLVVKKVQQSFSCIILTKLVQICEKSAFVTIVTKKDIFKENILKLLKITCKSMQSTTLKKVSK